ncbi:TPA: EutN/CcmL family microcompartment protein [Kluyvera ascorbata]|uniref:Ethanolamine utilization protein EutN n=1 Tax=Kluyvera genomosp. 2 TaxID=2774054 RepID=A0A2T2Y2P7_9ENTR|nr:MULTISPECIES: EutN/CcmL family microcompartment protein [Enterobacteriaceae]HAT3920512.1 EutN/CcmL family microcompartment protein [Kluyvera ascorbata]PSR46824.1 ethanolamine utilization protein EutN [Kluyvera genomosp. 2]BBQ84451.1 ethanolamine utilization protein EutN [Klebsiella sp. WP3-W18-ESBL-02]BBR21505.1 ethanolamine utilization protein EutN [Klebsiella sp. WP3-S18-ESBL-05]HAT3945422.1 EutN/CcmL family microcompartment protein [Kluyvera ascorbata]
MILAKVTGHVVATQKCDELRGSNLLMITQLDDEHRPMKDRTWVAVDSVGAGMHDIVLAEEYFALNKDRYKAMSVVAIVENVFRDA